MVAAILTFLFGQPEEINGNHRCPTYLYRWCLLRFRGRALYVHRFVGDDWSLDLHDHPKNFYVITLLGGYFETSYETVAVDILNVPVIGEYHGTIVNLNRKITKHIRAPYYRHFPPEHAHRVELRNHRECWSLVLVTGAVKQWGFWNSGKWYNWRDYVRGKFSHLADSRAVCRSIEQDAQLGQK